MRRDSSAAILARRMPHPPEEFVAIQLSRLNEALLVAFSAMSPTNLKAVDHVVKIVRALDRYGGAFAAEWRRPEASRLDEAAGQSPGLGAAWNCRAELALQDFEGLEFADKDALASAPAGDERVGATRGIRHKALKTLIPGAETLRPHSLAWVALAKAGAQGPGR